MNSTSENLTEYKTNKFWVLIDNNSVLEQNCIGVYISYSNAETIAKLKFAFNNETKPYFEGLNGFAFNSIHKLTIIVFSSEESSEVCVEDSEYKLKNISIEFDNDVQSQLVFFITFET